jgi:DNA-binding NarL/FixJ family response regulator
MSGEQILIVEDQRTVAGAMRTRLRGLGYDVTGIASSGKEAVAKAEELMPDLVLMDIRLGDGIDGIEAARQIRTSLDIPIIYVSAYADQEIIDRAKDTDPAGFINKPFTTKDLLTAIDLALYARKRRRPGGVAPVPRGVEETTPQAAVPQEGVITTDLTGNVVFMSQIAERQTGKKRRDLSGRPLAELLHELYGLTAADAQALVLQVLKRGNERKLGRRTTPDGEILADDQLTPLRDAYGECFGVALKLRPAALPSQEGRLAEQAAALGLALQPLPVGVVILSRQLRVLHSNHPAAALIDEGLGIETSGGALAARDAEQHGLLRSLVEQAAGADPRVNPLPIGVLYLKDQDGKERLEILVVPGRTGHNPASSPAAIAFLFDAAKGHTTFAEVLGSLCRMTQPEIRLLAYALDGLGADECALKLGLAPSAVRAHLKTLHQKIGTHGAAELLRRLPATA